MTTKCCMWHSALSEIVSLVLYVVGYHILILTGDSSYISGNVTSPFFSAKNVTVTVYLLELPLARFKKYHLLFSNYTSVFVRVQIKSGNVLLLLSSLFISSFNCPHERDQKVRIQPKPSRVGGIKSCQIVNLWQKKLLKYCCRLRGTY